MGKYVAFLRGINVGGHHKVPMAELRKEMAKLGFENIITLLNSGNIIFDSSEKEEKTIEQILASHLQTVFGFTVPVIARKADKIAALVKSNPFEHTEVTKDIRLYVTFLKEKTDVDIKLPWTSEDKSFQIREIQDKTVISVLDLSKSKTVKAMEILGKFFGEGVTTRNWKTIKRIADKCK
ncbi:MAG: DUF1697 domain-containing protein [Prolixibacteraceae bacterium]|nr:DUF1697 domain-containing protein [Prolixibacteraceae bacterium]